MAKTKKQIVKKNGKAIAKKSTKGSDDFAASLISDLNKEAGSNVAFNLSTDSAPTNIKRWISTGSRLLDGILSNQSKGGLPEGRVVEIQGPSSCGKSHICFEVAKATQKMGGIVVYIDTENATNLDNLKNLGIDVSSRFVFIQTACTEDIFKYAEAAIMKSRAMDTNVPVTIIWDSVAASAPKAELEGDYDQNSIGLQARVIGKGMRKITNVIGNENVLFLLVNQQRKNIGVMFGDDTTTPGGMSIPYACSTRIRITSTGQKQIKNKEGDVIGIQVKAKTIKNKVARPFRTCEFQIHFGHGIVEHEEVFDLFREVGEVTVGKEIAGVNGVGAWKDFTVCDKDGVVVHEVKFHKPDFANKVLNVPEFSKYVEAMYEAGLVLGKESVNSTVGAVDKDSFEEVMASKEKS